MTALSPPPHLSPDDSQQDISDALREESLPAARPALWFALAFVAVATSAFWLGTYSQQHTTKPAPVGPFVGKNTTTSSTLTVHVAGAVNRPGVYTFPFDARVRDAIRKAGGPTKAADVNALNLAAWLEDGTKIEVPEKLKPAPTSIPAPEENAASQAEMDAPLPDLAPTPAIQGTPAPNDDPVKKPRKIEPLKQKVLPDVPRASTAGGDESQNADPAYLEKHPLNLNTATLEQLELLPDVGPAMAQKILATRKEKGGYKSVDELDDVPGIGAKKLEKIRPLVTVD